MPVWMPESMNPGVTVLPPASTTRAPAGAAMPAPIDAIRAAADHDRAASIAAPDTGRMRALVIAMVSPPAGAAGRGAWPAAAGAAASGAA